MKLTSAGMSQVAPSASGAEGAWMMEVAVGSHAGLKKRYCQLEPFGRIAGTSDFAWAKSCTPWVIQMQEADSSSSCCMRMYFFARSAGSVMEPASTCSLSNSGFFQRCQFQIVTWEETNHWVWKPGSVLEE